LPAHHNTPSDGESLAAGSLGDAGNDMAINHPRKTRCASFAGQVFS